MKKIYQLVLLLAMGSLLPLIAMEGVFDLEEEQAKTSLFQQLKSSIEDGVSLSKDNQNLDHLSYDELEHLLGAVTAKSTALDYARMLCATQNPRIFLDVEAEVIAQTNALREEELRSRKMQCQGMIRLEKAANPLLQERAYQAMQRNGNWYEKMQYMQRYIEQELNKFIRVKELDQAQQARGLSLQILATIALTNHADSLKKIVANNQCTTQQISQEKIRIDELRQQLEQTKNKNFEITSIVCTDRCGISVKRKNTK